MVIPEVLGGIGLFLVGMVLVTDGLRAAAGDALRRFLLRFTGGVVKALLSGAAITALVQSSSAITVATIGFVGAGLLSFEQALGLIFGANIGTTATGWVVATFGLEYKVSTLALPLVGVGALVRLFSRGRAAYFGLAMAGFGIIFIGIDILQSGMAVLAQDLSPSALPRDTWLGRLLLVGIGTLLTTVMQSSSAAVATALAALHSGAISLHQAAAVVIGSNIGTTVTAGLAALGGSTAAKRTAFAHLLFNALTGSVAFAALPAFVWAVGLVGERIAPGNATILLASFHTAFNLVGVVLILPFSTRFAAMVTRVIRHRGPHLTRMLDDAAASQGSVATESVRQTVFEITCAIASVLEAALTRGKLTPAETEQLNTAAEAVRATGEYVGTLRFQTPLSGPGHQRHVSTIHALDHLQRLVDVALEVPDAGRLSADIRAINERARDALENVSAWTEDPTRPAPADHLRHVAESVSAERGTIRAKLLVAVAESSTSPTTAARRLEYLRWLEGLSHHLWRLVEHLGGERLLTVPAKDAAPQQSASERRPSTETPGPVDHPPPSNAD